MRDSLAGLVLCAGAGHRMRPLTLHRAKPMLPVVGRPLVDHAVDRMRTVTTDVAVNANARQHDLLDHAGRQGWHVGIEQGEALGTAGPLANMRDWIDGRPTVVLNGDTYVDGGLAALVEGWDGTRIRIMVIGVDPMGPRSRIAGCLMPFSDVAAVPLEPAGLWETTWRGALARGRVESIHTDGRFVDCATPVDYLWVNRMLAPDGDVDPTATIGPTAVTTGSVIGAGCRIEGTVVDSVVWPGATVAASADLRSAIVMAPNRTVLIRRDR